MPAATPTLESCYVGASKERGVPSLVEVLRCFRRAEMGFGATLQVTGRMFKAAELEAIAAALQLYGSIRFSAPHSQVSGVQPRFIPTTLSLCQCQLDAHAVGTLVCGWLCLLFKSYAAPQLSDSRRRPQAVLELMGCSLTDSHILVVCDAIDRAVHEASAACLGCGVSLHLHLCGNATLSGLGISYVSALLRRCSSSTQISATKRRGERQPVHRQTKLLDIECLALDDCGLFLEKGLPSSACDTVGAIVHHVRRLSVSRNPDMFSGISSTPPRGSGSWEQQFVNSPFQHALAYKLPVKLFGPELLQTRPRPRRRRAFRFQHVAPEPDIGIRQPSRKQLPQ